MRIFVAGAYGLSFATFAFFELGLWAILGIPIILFSTFAVAGALK